MNNLQSFTMPKSHGAVLVMSLMMLFVLTLIGVSSINTTSLEEKMTGNTRNRQLAFQAAETAVREAEKKITDEVNNPVSQFASANTTDGFYALSEGPSSTEALDKGWWLTTSGAVNNDHITYTGERQDVLSPARYTIEYLGETSQTEATEINIYGGEEKKGGEGSIHTFRITVRGTGLNDNAVVVIQSHFGKRI